ncbi:MAG: Lpg1974 family pore-forming outer membrane protein, partial [bacterium]|nr:Lpg1974 family pore-forming outer membrane protein [bacterium]
KGFSEGESYSAFPVAKFSGAGPRIGGDFGYGLVNNLTLYFNGAAEVLAGQSRFRNTYTLGSVVQPISHNKTMLVPEVDAKIGLNYTFNASQSTLILDGGYMWVNYFNAQ